VGSNLQKVQAEPSGIAHQAIANRLESNFREKRGACCGICDGYGDVVVGDSGEQRGMGEGGANSGKG
jgi:hypothetical protein